MNLYLLANESAKFVLHNYTEEKVQMGNTFKSENFIFALLIYYS